MGITSVTFGLFAGALLLVYYRVPGRLRWVVLLAGSWAFVLSAGWQAFPFLLGCALSTYLAARWMAGKDGKEARKPGLIACLIWNFGVLAGCKLAGWLPMGISFYTFQSAGYVLDVYRGRAEAEGNFLRHCLFLSYFPQLVQGPISRKNGLGPQLAEPREWDEKQISFGIQRMLWGGFKKLVIADRIAPAVEALKECDGPGFWLLTLFYGVQIYADFTGGIDMVLGLSQALGIELPENFDSPFRSRSVAEYWRRWHITLGSWMKDYIFYPVSVSAPLRRLGKAARKRWPKFGKRLPVYAASLVTWFATGIWHGVTANFVVWGMLNCAVIVGSEELAPLYRKFHSRFGWKERGWYGWFETGRTFLLMNLIRACDLFPNVGAYFRRVGTLFLPWKWEFALPEMGLGAADWVVLVFGVGLLVTAGAVRQKKGSLRELLWTRPGLRYGVMFGLFLVTLVLGCYGVGYDGTAFVYNQF